MQITVGEDTLNVDIEKKSFEESLHTGKRLRNFTVSFSASQSQRDRVKQIATTARSEGVTTLDDEGQVVRFSMSPGMSSYSNGGPVYYEWHLEEDEDLNVTTLTIEDLELTPYAYSEEFDDDGRLTINARVILSADQLERVEQFVDPDVQVTVIRRGISDEPRTMQLITGLWSDNDGVFKQHLVLLDRVQDTEHGSRRLLKGFDRLHLATELEQKSIVRHRALIDGILELLVAKDVISSSERDELTARGLKAIDSYRKPFNHVLELDDWQL